MAVGGNTICRRCEKFFKQNGREFCENCYSIMRSESECIREYIEKNPGVSIMDLSQVFDISMKNINLLLERQGFFLSAKEENKWT